MQNLHYVPFSKININSPFFDSLKQDYIHGFLSWWNNKANNNEYAYVLWDEAQNDICGFMYLKIEEGPVNDITHPLPYGRYLKIGTFKVDAVGTLRGQRFVKKILDFALHHQIQGVYTTVFSKHGGLIRLLEAYGFYCIGQKNSPNGIENVFYKHMINNSINTFNLHHNYPFIKTSNTNKHLLSIYPEFHTRLFPDSRLHTEKHLEIADVSATNSIHKVYLCAMRDVMRFRPGDILVIYRTADKTHAEYSSVATSLATVEEVRNIDSFQSIADYMEYVGRYSIFSHDELRKIWHTKRFPYIIKFLYNAALPKRIIRRSLIEDIGLDRDEYWGCFSMNDDQFMEIVKRSELNESLIVN